MDGFVLAMVISLEIWMGLRQNIGPNNWLGGVVTIIVKSRVAQTSNHFLVILFQVIT